MIEVRKNKKGITYRAKIYWHDGMPKRSPAFRLKNQAEDWERRMLIRRDEEKQMGVFGFSSLTVAEFSAQWMAEKVKPILAPSTYWKYEGALRLHIVPEMGERGIRDLTHTDASRLLQKLKGMGRSAKTVNCVLGVLQALLNDAREMRLIPLNPLAGFKPLREEIRDFAYWTGAEIRQFLTANASDPLYPLFLAALNTGLRRGELCGLKWDRVDLVGKRLTISRSLCRYGLRETTKSGKKRVIGINDPLQRCLSRLWSAQRGSFLFSQPNGEALNVCHLDRHFKAAQKRAGIANVIRFHDLRHTFASQFMMNGGNIYDLQKILGHSSLEMTQRYAHLSPEHLDEAMKVVSFDALERVDSPEIVPNAFPKEELVLVSGN